MAARNQIRRLPHRFTPKDNPMTAQNEPCPFDPPPQNKLSWTALSTVRRRATCFAFVGVVTGANRLVCVHASVNLPGLGASAGGRAGAASGSPGIAALSPAAAGRSASPPTPAAGPPPSLIPPYPAPPP